MGVYISLCLINLHAQKEIRYYGIFTGKNGKVIFLRMCRDRPVPRKGSADIFIIFWYFCHAMLWVYAVIDGCRHKPTSSLGLWRKAKVIWERIESGSLDRLDIYYIVFDKRNGYCPRFLYKMMWVYNGSIHNLRHFNKLKLYKQIGFYWYRFV